MTKYHFPVAAILSLIGATLAVPQPALAAGACAAATPQKAMAVAGTVIQVGKEPLTFQHMVVLDEKTNCRVVVLVENNDKPCAYLAHASITIPVAPATSAERASFGKIDYMDKGGNEMFSCK